MKFTLLSLAILVGTLISTSEAQANCSAQRKTLKFSDGTQVKVRIHALDDIDENPPTIIIIPPTGGTNTIDRRFGRFYCRNDFRAVILDRWTGDEEVTSIENLTDHRDELLAGERAVRRVAGFFHESKIGISTSSKGAIATSAFAHRLPANVRALFFAVPGAPLHLTISRAGEKNLKKLRDERMRHFSFKTQAQYDQAIKKAINPYQTARRPGRIKVAVMYSEKDSVVPTELQKNFVRLWRPDKSWKTQNPHGQTVAMSYFRLKEQVLDFFVNHLK